MGRCYRASASIGIHGLSDEGFTLRLVLVDAPPMQVRTHTKMGACHGLSSPTSRRRHGRRARDLKNPRLYLLASGKHISSVRNVVLRHSVKVEGLNSVTSEDLPSQAAVSGDVAAKPGVAPSGMVQDQGVKFR